MNQRSRGIRRRTVAFVALAAAVVFGGIATDPVSAAAAPTMSGSKTNAPRRDTSPPAPPNPKFKTPTLPPVGKALFFVPRRQQAITSFSVWLDADLSEFKEVKIDVKNATESQHKVFDFTLQNEVEGNIGDSSDQVSITLDIDDPKLHHLLSFDLQTDYNADAGCSTTWNKLTHQETWSIHVSGVLEEDSGGSRQGIPLQRVRVRSYDYGTPCPGKSEEHVRHCIEPGESVVVHPSPGEVLGCTMTTIEEASVSW